jgi:hypothetical protein
MSIKLILFCILGEGWSAIRSTRHCGHQWPIVSAPSDYNDGEIGGMNGTGNRSSRRKPSPVPLCPPQTPHAAGCETGRPRWEASVYPLELRHGPSL